MYSRCLKRSVDALSNQLSVGPTGSLRRLDVGKGNSVSSEISPIQVALFGRDVDPLGLIPPREVFSRPNSDTKDGGGEEKRGYKSLEVEHRYCGSPSPTTSHFYQDGASGAYVVGRSASEEQIGEELRLSGQGSMR